MAFNKELLANLREEQRYSQRELAKAAGVKSSFIASVEAGRSKNPNYPDLRKVADILGVPDVGIFFADPADSTQQAS